MSTPSRTPPTRAFTLIEVMVVILIIAVLTGIVITVAQRVASGGKRTLTEHTLRVLDQSLTEYIAARDGRPPAYFEDARGYTFPIIDGRRDPLTGTGPTGPAEPSVSLFLLDAMKIPAVSDAIKNLDQSLVERGTITTSLGAPQVRNAGNALEDAVGVVVKDAWKNPIRFVHPAYHGGFGAYHDGNNMRTRSPRKVDYIASGGTLTADYSRSYRPFNPAAPGSDSEIGDADEGLCPGGRPYFYSAGPDGDPGTREDNVYITLPQFPPETGKLN